jgi:DNA-binding PadR family transcriptional regulator
MPAPELTPTARVILGMIGIGQRTGSDIKQFVDKTTRLFWAASYGQIYPELRRLEAAGLVVGRSEPTGDRARKVYELTDDGREALRAWLSDEEPEPMYELRDEGMLKLFFSDALPERRIENIRRMRERHEGKLAHLRSIEPHAKAGPAGLYLTLQFGVAQTEFFIKWCEEAERRLADDPDAREV